MIISIELGTFFMVCFNCDLRSFIYKLANYSYKILLSPLRSVCICCSSCFIAGNFWFSFVFGYDNVC